MLGLTPMCVHAQPAYWARNVCQPQMWLLHTRPASWSLTESPVYRSACSHTALGRRQGRCLAQHSYANDSGSRAQVVPRVAVEGDVVTLHYTCTTETGEVVESSRADGSPLSLELGAGEAVSNKIFQAFDAAVRGLGIGHSTVIEASGGEWQPSLLFDVPLDHPEAQRLQGRYETQGGLAPGMVVELANGAQALILEITDKSLRLDANNMLAGKRLQFELELVSIEQGV